MKKLFVALLLANGLASQLFAEEHESEKGFYVVGKGLVSTAETITEPTGVILEGHIGGGLGLDIGYKLPFNFAVELDTSYALNNVTENNGGALAQAQGRYVTYGVDLTYTYHMTHVIALMGKVGYEGANETIDALGINKLENDLVFGLGMEYEINNSYEAVVEYEQATVASTRGSSIFFGVKYNL